MSFRWIKIAWENKMNIFDTCYVLDIVLGI